MDQPIEKFQRLLRELFQFDCADLDFGIYRIMNYKRDVIEQFITKDLPEAIAEELDCGALADQSQAAKELKEVAEQIRKDLDKDALDADGNLAEAYHKTPLGKKYLDLKAKAAGGAAARPSKRASSTISIPSSVATTRTAISSRSAGTPSARSTPSHTTARKSTCTGPTMTSITSRPPSTSTTTPSPRTASRCTSSSRRPMLSRITSRATNGSSCPASRRSNGREGRRTRHPFRVPAADRAGRDHLWQEEPAGRDHRRGPGGDSRATEEGGQGAGSA